MDIMGNGGPQVVALRRPGRLGEMHRGWFRDEVITENIGRRSERKRVAQCFVSWKRKVKLSTRNDSCVRGFVLGPFVCVGPQAFFWCKPFQHTATLPRRTTEIHDTTPGQHLHTRRTAGRATCSFAGASRGGCLGSHTLGRQTHWVAWGSHGSSR